MNQYLYCLNELNNPLNKFETSQYITIRSLRDLIPNKKDLFFNLLRDETSKIR